MEYSPKKGKKQSKKKNKYFLSRERAKLFVLSEVSFEEGNGK